MQQSFKCKTVFDLVHTIIVCVPFVWGTIVSADGGSIVVLGDYNSILHFVPNPNMDFIALSAGNSHGLGLRSDGSIEAWGSNTYGECNVPGPNADFVAVAGGQYFSLGLKANGSIIAWGRNNDGQCAVPNPNSDFIAVSAGGDHGLGLKSDGSIVAWGDNGQGQCDVPDPNSEFIAISAGDNRYSLGLKSDGTVLMWGRNAENPDPNEDFVAISAGRFHRLGLKSDGSIFTWGSNSFGQCDVPDPNADFITIAAGTNHSLGLKSDGSIVAWGNNNHNQCNVPNPNTEFIALSGGSSYSAGLKSVSLGACCIPGELCQFTTLMDCELVLGGTYLGDGVNCEPHPCVGACCLNGGVECIDTVTIFDCEFTYGGMWQGTDTSCVTINCADVFKVVADDEEPMDHFGSAIAVDGDTAVIGAPNWDPWDSAAYVFQKTGSHWEQVAQLLHDTGAHYTFGDSVAISGDTIVVGSWYKDGVSPGSAHVYTKPIGGWSGMIYESAQLFASDGDYDDLYGKSVSISPHDIFGEVIVVGAPNSFWHLTSGTAYVYHKPSGGWSGNIYEDARLLSSDGEQGDSFGWSVSIEGDVVVVGANEDDDNSEDSGSAYVFVGPYDPRRSEWYFESAKLLPTVGAKNDFFGGALSLSGDTVVVGESHHHEYDFDSVYVFEKPAGGWSGTLNENARLVASDVEMSDQFGVSVSIFDDTIAVGAKRDDDNGENSGSAYIFRKPISGWTGIVNEDSKLSPSDGFMDDEFGTSVLVTENMVVVGMPYDDTCSGYPYCNSGSVYIFNISTTPCPADLTGDDQVNIDDIFAALGLWGDCPDPCPPYCAGDLTEDCTVNIDDIFAILGMWGPCD